MAVTVFNQLLEELEAGTLTALMIDSSGSLSPAQREALYEGLTSRTVIENTSPPAPTPVPPTPVTQTLETGDQASPPSGVWSSWLVFSQDDALIVDGIPLKSGSSHASASDDDDKIPSPTMSGSGNYRWKGYR